MSARILLYQHDLRSHALTTDLIRIVDGNPKRVLSIADRSGPELGVRSNFDEGAPLRYETFGEMAQAAAAGKCSIPIARTFPLEEWREAVEISVSGKAGGKLLLLPNPINPRSPRKDCSSGDSVVD